MNEEEVEVLESEQEQPQQEVEQPAKQRQSVNDRVDSVRDSIDSVGKTVENVGKGEERVADLLDGGDKVTKTASDIGTATSSAAEKGASAAKKAAEAKEKAAETAETAARGAKEASKAGKTAAQVGKAASKGAEGAGEGMSAAGSSPYTAGLKAAGEAVKAGGKVGEGISTAAETGAQAAETAAATAEAGAKTAKEAARAEKAALNAAEAGAKASKAGNQAVKNASDKSFSDKLRERGKINQARGKRIQDQASKFDSNKVVDDLTDKLGKGGKALGNALKGILKLFDPRTIAVIFLLTITVGTLVVSYLLSPMFFMNIIAGTAADPDRVEKVKNYMDGLGFADSEEAFYKEVDYLNTHYGKELDFSYIMSALYYVDIYYSGSEYYYIDDNTKLCGDISGESCGSLQLGFQFAKQYLKEANTTVGADGLTYSANKLYRLRELAKHQFSGKRTSKATLNEYVQENAVKMQNEIGNMSKYSAFLVAYIIAHVDPTTGTIYDQAIANTEGGKILTDFIASIEGTESWASIKMYFDSGKYDSDLVSAITNFLKTYFGCVTNIESIDFNLDDLSELPNLGASGLGDIIKITYYQEAYNADAFEDYLIDYYIRYMPEFSRIIRDKDGKVYEDKIEQIAYEIKLTKTVFDSLYQKDETAQLYSRCIGDINLDLLNELTPPVDLTVGQAIVFEGSNNYGLYKGISHRGVDLEESSTGTKAGDNVYSIYDGKVLESTVDGTYKDKTTKGGWLVIEYTVQYEDSSLGKSKLSMKFKSKMSTIKVYYGGLDSNRLTLKQNDIVSKGEVIGYVGDSSMSETGEKPSVHFGIYDVKNSVFLNPINMFITCKSKGGASSCSNGGTTIEIPDSVLDINQINYDVEQYDNRGFGGNGIDPTSTQKKVHQLWLDDGERYTKGIAVINVNGSDRYLVAVTKKFGNIGDIINANLENGEVIELVIADEKDYRHTQAVNNGELCDNDNTTDPGCYGHYKGSSGLGVLEFDFNPVEIFQNGIYSASTLGPDWDTSQKVISISNCGSVFDQ